MKNEAFKDYVTATAFNLSLTKKQVWMLSMVHQSQVDNLVEYGWSVTTGDILKRKGLLKDHFELSEAGEAVIPLLKLAGIYQKVNLKKKAA